VTVSSDTTSAETPPTETVPPRLPRGRHGLSRQEVAASQRDRILWALAETMAHKGYVATTVADVLKAAGVSRETFYQQFSSKQDAFMAAFDAAAARLLDQTLVRSGPADGVDRADAGPLERFDRVLGAYLDGLAAEPAFARTFLVEVYAAGPEALARRARLQGRVVDLLVDELGFGDERRVACDLVVAGTAALVTPLLVQGDLDGVRALRGPLVEVVSRLLA
jgi:AcrR family transcriptional regulator